METMDFGKQGICLKCGKKLDSEDEKRGLPICYQCTNDLAKYISDRIGKRGIQKFSDDTNNFTDFVVSSSKLMKIDDIGLIQTCFNIYMNTVKIIAKSNLHIAKIILNDTRRFIDIEIENFEKEDNIGNNVGDNVELDVGNLFKEVMNRLGADIKKDDDKKDRPGSKRIKID